MNKEQSQFIEMIDKLLLVANIFSQITDIMPQNKEIQFKIASIVSKTLELSQELVLYSKGITNARN
jgi:hypothetical protein